MNRRRKATMLMKMLLLLLGVLLLPNIESAYPQNAKDLKRGLPKPYFLLVPSSYENELKKFDLEKIKVINESPYHGVAVRVIWEFDDRPFEFEELRRRSETIRLYSEKDIWPRVFLNRIIGTDEKDNIPGIIKDKPYFLRIKGMDIFDDAGCLSDFYNIWRSSLKLAKSLSSPGVIFDIEAYNKYTAYKIDYLSKKHNKSPSEIKNQLRVIGSKLTGIVAEEYPDAVVWFLFTSLGDPVKSLNPFESEYRSVGYIAEGMIREAEERNLPTKFIDGGQVDLRYCHVSVEDLDEKIASRRERMKSILLQHPKLCLGGTIAPWNDVKAKKGWMADGLCGRSDLRIIEDFAPFIRSLANSYDYIWIYATPVGGYDPFNKEIATAFNKTLRRVFLGARRN